MEATRDTPTHRTLALLPSFVAIDAIRLDIMLVSVHFQR